MSFTSNIESVDAHRVQYQASSNILSSWRPGYSEGPAPTSYLNDDSGSFMQANPLFKATAQLSAAATQVATYNTTLKASNEMLLGFSCGHPCQRQSISRESDYSKLSPSSCCGSCSTSENRSDAEHHDAGWPGSFERQEAIVSMQNNNERRKMKRFRLTHSQTRFLMNEFARQAHPDAAHRERLSREIPGLSQRQVQIWFQNRRAKLKRIPVEDRQYILQARAVPDTFDMAQTMRDTQHAVVINASGPQIPPPILYETAGTATSKLNKFLANAACQQSEAYTANILNSRQDLMYAKQSTMYLQPTVPPRQLYASTRNLLDKSPSTTQEHVPNATTAVSTEHTLQSGAEYGAQRSTYSHQSPTLTNRMRSYGKSTIRVSHHNQVVGSLHNYPHQPLMPGSGHILPHTF